MVRGLFTQQKQALSGSFNIRAPMCRHPLSGCTSQMVWFLCLFVFTE